MKFNRKEEEDYSLSLTPLIDVVFLLLIFFMVSTAFVDFTRKMDIQLPESDAGAVMENVKVYEIEMTEKGAVYVNGESVSVDALAEILKQSDKKKKKRSAVIRADKRLDFGKVVKVMGLCQKNGIMDIGVAVQ